MVFGFPSPPVSFQTMRSAKKGLICNLNHVHLQHVSLGLHLSRHPELQDDGKPLLTLQSDCITCQACQEHGTHIPNVVDANSNNPSVQCRCCDDHLLQAVVKQGIQQTKPASPNQTFLKAQEEEEEEEEEEEGASSSVSSCSDLSLDNTPVSVYCKPFPGEEARSPESQPNIVPLEEAQRDLSGAEQEERSLNLNTHTAKRPPSRIWDSPDSLCSSSSLDSSSGPGSPCPQSPVGSPPPSSHGPPPRPCRAPPAIPASKTATKLDSNCNAMPAPEAKMEKLSSGQVDVNSNHAAPAQHSFSRVPPPVPPRTKRGLQSLRRSQSEKPAPEVLPPSAPPAPAQPPLCLGEVQSEDGRRTITSFHELAQKRKKATSLGLPQPQTRKDQSDWLIVFSPDTELPPCNELTFGATPCQDAPGPLGPQPEPMNPIAPLQRGVTTFKELRYRKQQSQLAAKGSSQAPWPADPCKGRPDGEMLAENEAELLQNGPFSVPKEIQPWKKKPRPGLQPIVEGGGGEEGEDNVMERKPSDRSLEAVPNGGRRDSWMPGKEESGDKRFMEAGNLPAHPSRPQSLPFQPLLVHVSMVDGQATAAPPRPSRCPGLEKVQLIPRAPPGPAFCPQLKTLSCEEVCLLAGSKGQVFGTLSPEELLPIRLSPIGAYSPPARSALPFLDSPDLAVLFSPLFPRSRTFPALAFPSCQVPPERPFGARGPLGGHAGAGPRRVSWDHMATKKSGLPEQLRHSQSFGGVPSAGQPWAPDAGRAKTQLQEQKKALLMAVSASVDKIVGHFSTARNLVQKAQLGDSRISPDVGYLVLSTLCPALRALISDGLKPFQKDVITGQRPSSPWSVVEASVKPGPQARSLNALYWRISRLAPLRNNQQRFHAFIMGLLNMKQLEQWFAHLQRNSELISALYFPTAFLLLSQGFCRCWGDELLLLLQPLSMLTFQLDLLFEHQYLPLDVRPAPRQQVVTPPELTAASWKAQGPSWLDFPKGQSSAAGLAEGSLAQLSSFHEPHGGLPLHQRLLRWGDQLSQTFLGKETVTKPEAADAQDDQQGNEDKPHSWWEQLGRASGVYADSSPSKEERSPRTHWIKLRMALREAIKEAHTATKDTTNAPVHLQTPNPEESSQVTSKQAPTHGMENSPQNEAIQTTVVTIPEAGKACPDGGQVATEGCDSGNSPGSQKGKWLGWLFGATSPGAGGCLNEPDSDLNKSSRRPSSWLTPNVNVLTLVMKMVPSEKSWPEELWDVGPPDSLQPSRAVRALCDHSASEDGHLSFHKGDILQVLDMVNEDWIQCCHGERKGLVPVGYTSLVL